MALATILLVEDDFLVQDVMQFSLEDAGFAVVPAENARLALDALRKRPGEFDVLVTDVNLGEGADGWAVARAAREMEPHIAVLYVSGDSEHVWRERGVPASALLPKPFDGLELVRKVQEISTPSAAA